MNFRTTARFHPSLDPLESRALLSAVSASLSKGVLTVSRDDPARTIQVDILTISFKKAGQGPARGAVIVRGGGQFVLRKVKSITIDPGPSVANVVVNKPPSVHIPVRVIAPGPPPRAITPPVNVGDPGGLAVPGVTGVQSALEQRIFDLVNAERVKAGVTPLKLDARLVTASQVHARDMAALDMMEHDLPGVAQPTLISRAQFVGYSFGWLGENIGSFYTDATSLVAGWMASPGHRSNILNTDLRDGGIGVGRDAQGNLFFCQMFASPVA